MNAVGVKAADGHKAEEARLRTRNAELTQELEKDKRESEAWHNAVKLADLPADVAGPASKGIANAFGVAAQVETGAARIVEAAKDSFVDSWIRSMWVGVVIAGVAALYLVVLGPRRTRNTDAVPVGVLVDARAD